MAIPLQAVLSAIGNVGAEIFSEMSSTSWEAPTMASIRESGVTVGCHPGAGRSRNEDRAVVADVTALDCDPLKVAIVCDGVGGSEMGDTAAALTVATFLAELANFRDRRPLYMHVIAAIRRADDVVRTQCKGRGATTLSVLAASSTGEHVAANVGDSRIFSWNAKTDQIEQLSVDDTLENEMRNLKVADHSFLNAHGLRGSLSQAIGEEGRQSNELGIRIIGRERLGAGAILATDGAWKGQESGFNAIAVYADSGNQLVNRLIHFALWTGGMDNISVIAIDDIDTFAKDGGVVASRATSSRISLWACGKKTTICWGPSLVSATFDKGLPSPSTAARRKRSRKAKRRVGEPATVHDQMFEKDADRPAARPNIEVSTDDNAT